jgi:hypothetical protein
MRTRSPIVTNLWLFCLLIFGLLSEPAHGGTILYVGDYIGVPFVGPGVNRYDASDLSVGNIPPALSPQPFIGGNSSITRVEAIRGYGDKILVAIQGGTVQEFNVSDGTPTGRSWNTQSNVYDMAISSDGQSLYTAHGSHIRKTNLATNAFSDQYTGATNSWGLSIRRTTDEVYVNSGWTSGVNAAGVFVYDANLNPVLIGGGTGNRIDNVLSGANQLTAGVGLEVLDDGSFYAVNGIRDVLTNPANYNATTFYNSFVNYYNPDGTLNAHITISDPGMDLFGTAIGPNGNLFIANFLGAEVIEVDTAASQYMGIYVPPRSDLASVKTLFFSTQTIRAIPEPSVPLLMLLGAIVIRLAHRVKKGI